ncbi:MAG: hypothetical protein IIW54_15225 [Lachnospiraceae bacterium]|nr:hypothetical protein [Lachnospiraceae bacterium]
MDYINRNRRTFRHLGKVCDVIMIVMAAVILVCGLLLVLDTKNRMILFPVIFLASSIMNISKGVKTQKQRENIHAIMLYVAGAILLVLSILGFVVII